MPPDPVLIGLLDSGVDPALGPRVVAARAFRPTESGTVEAGPAGTDVFGHGTTLARIILDHAPAARLLDAQVLGARGTTSAAAVAAGLDWLVSERATLINMSLGLRADRAVLRDACAAARDAGCVLLAAAPARGEPVYPAAYPDVIRVSGDARCGPDDISHLASAQADFGACVRAGDSIAGASIGVAHATGLLADAFAAAEDRDRAAAEAALIAMARYQGPERRGAT